MVCHVSHMSGHCTSDIKRIVTQTEKKSVQTELCKYITVVFNKQNVLEGKP